MRHVRRRAADCVCGQLKRTQATCELRSMVRELTALLKARHTRITVTNVTDVPNPAALFYASIVNE